MVTAGRGIAALVRDVSHALCVRIIAPFDVRVERVMKKEHLEHTKAAHRIREYDRYVTSRIGYLFGPEWLLPENYDLVLNTVRDDPALYVDIIAAMAAHPRFAATPESTQLVRDLSLAAHVRAALAQDPHTRSGVHIEVTANKGHVSLTPLDYNMTRREALAQMERWQFQFDGPQSESAETEPGPAAVNKRASSASRRSPARGRKALAAMFAPRSPCWLPYS